MCGRLQLHPWGVILALSDTIVEGLGPCFIWTSAKEAETMLLDWRDFYLGVPEANQDSIG